MLWEAGACVVLKPLYNNLLKHNKGLGHTFLSIFITGNRSNSGSSGNSVKAVTSVTVVTVVTVVTEVTEVTVAILKPVKT